ncbi:MAG: UDP-N-acetylenolpyruvoylglucosamine reductase, partial [Alphaproteobacteria bacterium]|nr:UDP-N-acetylenolpyruvoylglucosamine reductase [Alphaproteobacteria bacterium]
MADTCLDHRLLDRLPAVRGRYQEDAPLSKLTWFGTGGPADVLYRPADEEDLVRFMEGCPKDIPIMVMGVGSNLLVRDGGIRGVVIRLSRGFARVRINGEFVVAG